MNRPEEPCDDRTLARHEGPSLPMQQMPPIDDWASMGKAFEGMCKAGLALTIGFSVAAAFCKMMDARNVNIPTMVNRLAASVFVPEEKEPDGRH